MEWLAPIMCIVCAMLACTGIVTIDLKAIRRELKAGQQPPHDSPERGPSKVQMPRKYWTRRSRRVSSSALSRSSIIFGVGGMRER